MVVMATPVRVQKCCTSYNVISGGPPCNTDLSVLAPKRKNKFISSHPFPVPAIGLIPSPSSAPAHCWSRNTPSRSRQPQTDPEYPLKLAHQFLARLRYHPSSYRHLLLPLFITTVTVTVAYRHVRYNSFIY